MQKILLTLGLTFYSSICFALCSQTYYTFSEVNFTDKDQKPVKKLCDSGIYYFSACKTKTFGFENKTWVCPEEPENDCVFINHATFVVSAITDKHGDKKRLGLNCHLDNQKGWQCQSYQEIFNITDNVNVQEAHPGFNLSKDIHMRTEFGK